MILTLQSLRFVLILLVVLSHIIGASFDFGGECGVAFFFVLSGLVVSRSQDAKVAAGTFSTRAFVWRQLRKFYPWHLVTCLMMVAWDTYAGVPFSAIKTVLQVLLVQSWIPNQAYYFYGNGVSWFLCDILFCYVMYAPLQRWMTRTPVRHIARVMVTLAVIYLALACWVPDHHTNDYLYAPPVLRLFDFALGMALTRILQSPTGLRVGQRVAQQSSGQNLVIEIALLALWTGSFFAYQALPCWLRCCALFWPVAPVVLGYFVLADKGGGAVTRLLHHPLLLKAGSASMLIYLLHMPVLRILHAIVRHLPF